MVSPICLFYLNKKNELMPIAIQIFQEPSATNPVYFPSDPNLTWILAKMFFNMGEAQVHQSSSHIGIRELSYFEFFGNFSLADIWLACVRRTRLSHFLLPPIFN